MSQGNSTANNTLSTSSASVSTTLVPYVTVVSENYPVGYTWTGQANASFLVTTESSALANFSTVVAATITSGEIVQGQGIVTLSPAQSASTNGTSSGTTSASDGSATAGSGENSGGTKSSGVSPGAVAGAAIGALIVGALIACLVLIMLQKRKQRRQRPQKAFAAGAGAPDDLHDEKVARSAVNVAAQNDSFDLDRLLPQPLDDSTVKGEASTLFTHIDGHVENFYNDARMKAAARVSNDQAENARLQNPTTRFFAIKRIMCSAMIEAIDIDCPSDRSLLPCRFGAISRQLREPNLDDHANALSWSRLRASIGYLLRSDLSSDERKRVDQAIVTILERLNVQIQPFELPGSSSDRAADLEAICRSSASLGRLLLSQPAAWKFEWQTGASSSAGNHPQLHYFPALVRLTDNKARKLRSPYVAFPAKTASL